MRKQMLQLILSCVGWIAVILGVIGIFLPLLPTTPFILLAAACFAKSSPRFHNWLTAHPHFGKIVSTWQDGKGLPLRVRNRILIVMWLGMTLSMIIVAKIWSTLMLITIGIAVSIYIMRQPIAREKLPL